MVLIEYLGNNTEITLPAGYCGANYYIGKYAFSSCTGLTSITIPDSYVVWIDGDAFAGCNSLTSLKVASGNTVYDSREGCNAIIETATNTLVAGCKSTTIPNSVTSIGNSAFYGCTGLTSIIIPNSVTSIGSSAFSNCYGLTNVTIPNSVTSIGSWAFDNCYGLTAVHISDLSAWCNIDFDNNDSNPLIYAKNLYLNGSKVTNLIIPNEVIEIKEVAFRGCTGLTSVTIPNSVTSIGEEAFYGCTNLTSVEIPNSVTSIGDWAFSGCNIETVINLSPAFSLTAGSQECGWVASCAYKVINAPNGSILGNFVFQYIDGAETLVGYYGNDTKIKLPNSYNGGNYIVGDGAFANDVTITSLIISDSATSIGNGAFVGCTGLKKVDIVNAVTNVGESAFEGCTNLEALYISSNIESIGDKAFYGCDNLLDIKTGAIRAITANENVFSTSVYNNACLYVPKGRKFAYEKTTPWNKFFITEMDFTDIGDVETDDVLSSEKGVYYDLNGCPVNEPVKSGVYIRNGKKVLIR